MSIVSASDALYAMQARGNVGFGRGYGNSRRGKMRYGWTDSVAGILNYGSTSYGTKRYYLSAPISGIYSRKLIAKGAAVTDPKAEGRWGTSCMKFYLPTNRRKPAQQAWRVIFADGVTQYHSLTDDERDILYKKATTRGMTGFNLFMSHWLQARRS